ncbi:hypothetical protein BJV78DRAFT_1154344 [Lactifluus subvellereus]|nr:hypothetical protein BJV78DRAFT_1154344 [Lactifluus subvellereus]
MRSHGKEGGEGTSTDAVVDCLMANMGREYRSPKGDRTSATYCGLLWKEMPHPPAVVCGVVEYGSMSDGNVWTDEKERKEERIRGEQDGVSFRIVASDTDRKGLQHHCSESLPSELVRSSEIRSTRSLARYSSAARLSAPSEENDNSSIGKGGGTCNALPHRSPGCTEKAQIEMERGRKHDGSPSLAPSPREGSWGFKFEGNRSEPSQCGQACGHRLGGNVASILYPLEVEITITKVGGRQKKFWQVTYQNFFCLPRKADLIQRQCL